jgi:RNA-directed DNA polymerase
MDAIAVIMPLFNTSNKHYYVIEGDIRSYFDTVHHRKLLSLIKRRIADKDIIDLIWKFLKAGVMEGQLFAKTEQGVPQGGICSPLLANIYLHELDKWAEEKWDLTRSKRQMRRAAKIGNYKMIRYADDFVVVSNGTLAEVRAAKEELKDFLRTSLHLELSEEKTKITHINDGIDFLGFHIQRVKPEGKWVVHLRPTEKGKERIKKKMKDLTKRGWTWLDEYIQLTRLNALARGWAEYYKHTSLLEDIEEVTRYVWFRYLQWLMRKHKGARKHQLITTKTKVIHDRTRWTATIQEEGVTLDTYQWLPTRTELKRTRYPQKGKAGFKHPYIWEAEPAETDYPQGETGPAEHLYTDTIGARSREKEPLKMSEIKLRVKIRDHFTCQRCGHTGNSCQLQVHHRKGLTSHRMQDLETLCQRCHQSITSQQKAS